VEHNREEDTTTKSQDKELAGTETILLVDDEEHLLDGGKEILDYYGYKALVAETGERALEILSEKGKDIDLVVMDLIMPGMGGLKCLGEILRIDPEAKIVITSGYAANTTRSDLLAKGAVGFIEKPYRLQDLLGTIRSVLDKSAG
jgi:two-component system, cell cycle sensor histidine kinase and response regulator CckA